VGAKIGAIIGASVGGLSGGGAAAGISANKELEKSQRKTNLINAKMLIEKKLRENGVRAEELQTLKGKVEAQRDDLQEQVNLLRISLWNTNELLTRTQTERDD